MSPARVVALFFQVQLLQEPVDLLHHLFPVVPHDAVPGDVQRVQLHLHLRQDPGQVCTAVPAAQTHQQRHQLAPRHAHLHHDAVDPVNGLVGVAGQRQGQGLLSAALDDLLNRTEASQGPVSSFSQRDSALGLYLSNKTQLGVSFKGNIVINIATKNSK